MSQFWSNPPLSPSIAQNSVCLEKFASKLHASEKNIGPR